MRILILHAQAHQDYACRVYWVTGERRDAQDVNALVDAGSPNPHSTRVLMEALERQSKGIGKRAVELVVLTHGHYDHSGGVPQLAAQYRPRVAAWADLPGVTEHLRDGSWLRLGDEDFRVLHTPGHSEDSICLFSPASGTLFSGDTLHRIHDSQGAYARAFLTSLERLCALQVRAIYPGHDDPILEGAGAYLCSIRDRVAESPTLDPEA